MVLIDHILMEQSRKAKDHGRSSLPRDEVRIDETAWPRPRRLDAKTIHSP